MRRGRKEDSEERMRMKRTVLGIGLGGKRCIRGKNHHDANM